MLVKFECNNVPTVTMFGNHAVELLKLMGQSGVVPGGLEAADVAPALARLQAALSGGAASQPAPEPGRSAEREDAESERAAVSLGARAQPLVDFLQRAAKAHCAVTWTS